MAFQKFDLCSFRNSSCMVLDTHGEFVTVGIQEDERGRLFVHSMPQSALSLTERVGEERAALLKLCKPILLDSSLRKRLPLQQMAKLHRRDLPQSTYRFDCLHTSALARNEENGYESDEEQYLMVEASVLQDNGTKMSVSFEDLENNYCIDSRSARSNATLRSLRLQAPLKM